MWRISNDATLDGRGGLYASARWHKQGHPVVYLAASPAEALLEVMVHLEIREGRFPTAFQLLKLNVPEDVSRESLATESLAGDWITDQRITRSAGDQWIAAGRSALLEVPSVIVPETTNWLLNPVHPDARRVVIEWSEPFPTDGRLFRRHN